MKNDINILHHDDTLEFQTSNYEFYISNIKTRMISDNKQRHEYAFVPSSWHRTDNFCDKIVGEKTGVIIINLHEQNTDLADVLISLGLIPENIDTVVTVHARPIISARADTTNAHYRIFTSDVFNNSNIIYSGIPISQKVPIIKTSDIERRDSVMPVKLPTIRTNGKIQMTPDPQINDWCTPRFSSVYNGPLTEENMVCGARQFLAAVLVKAVAEYMLIKTRVFRGTKCGQRIPTKIVKQAIGYLNIDNSISLDTKDLVPPLDMQDMHVVPTLMQNINSFPEAKKIIEQAYQIATLVVIHQALVLENRPNIRKSNESFKAYKERIGYPYIAKAYISGVPLTDLLPVAD